MNIAHSKISDSKNYELFSNENNEIGADNSKNINTILFNRKHIIPNSEDLKLWRERRSLKSNIKYKQFNFEKLENYNKDEFKSFTPYQIKFVHKRCGGFANPNYMRFSSFEESKVNTCTSFSRSVSEDPSLYLLRNDCDILVLDGNRKSKRKHIARHFRREAIWRRYSTLKLRKSCRRWRKSFRKVFQRNSLEYNRINSAETKEVNPSKDLKKSSKTFQIQVSYPGYATEKNEFSSIMKNNIWVVKINDIKVKNRGKWKHHDKGLKVKTNDRSTKWTSNIS